MAPRIDVAETKDAIELTAELPGVEEKDVDLTLADGVLTIRGEKKTERNESDPAKNWHVVERSYGSFSRSIALPFDPDPAKTEAKFEKGVLRVRLAKPPGGRQETAEDRDQEGLTCFIRREERGIAALFAVPHMTAARRPISIAASGRSVARLLAAPET